jgi:hypothetical protein
MSMKDNPLPQRPHGNVSESPADKQKLEGRRKLDGVGVFVVDLFAHAAVASCLAALLNTSIGRLCIIIWRW